MEPDQELPAGRWQWACPLLALIGGGLLLTQVVAGAVPLPVAAALATAVVVGGVVFARLLSAQHVRLQRMAQMLRHREQILQQAVRMRTRGELSGMAVHQLRNQLQIAAGHTALGLHDSAADQRARFAAVEQAILACRGITETLLGGAASDRIERIDAAATARRVVAALAALLPPEVQLDATLPAGDAPVQVVARELEDALVNLILNASQAVGSAGRITLSLTRDAGRILIAVADDGPGIAPQDAPHLFRPFFTTKGAGVGSGLGLVAVERFARSAGGHVEVISQPGAGARFTIHLPAVLPASVRA